MGFSGQVYWSGLPFPSPGDRPNPGIEPMSPALAGGFFTTEPSENKTAKDKLTLQFGDIKLKLFICLSFREPKSF